MKIDTLLKQLGINLAGFTGKDLDVFSPIDGLKLASLKTDTAKNLDSKIKDSVSAFKIWRDVPAPKRGELIRILGDELRANKENLAKLVTIECGKIYQEGLGEVQEMIDICDFAVGLSRTVGGLTLPSERPEHTMQENWYPLGTVAVISAFNFPVAVWAWNFALAIVCGNSVIWKPSEKTPLCAIACQKIFENAVKKYSGEVPQNLSQIIIAGRDVGEKLVSDKRIDLVSATGSTQMGRNVGVSLAQRFGRSLLELGGNNAIIVTPSANLDIALPSILFGAVGTAGQRCTSTRRIFVHEKIYDNLFLKLKIAYKNLKNKIGNPLEEVTLIGPLIDEASFKNMQNALVQAKKSGAEIIGGERVKAENKNAFYVEPALVKLKKPIEIVNQETFAPILYVMPYKKLEDAIEMNNSVPQGLSSAIFTNDLKEAEIFKKYSDCGIANVNIGTSGAEIGGAFGGEKETGGGRESGSDSWKYYMRRQTSTTYYGSKKPALAQGIKFDNGFTIIEMAIVIVIIGLLVSGILGAQTIIENVKRIRFINTVSEVKTQKNIYFSKYSAIPGDDSNASKYFGQECEDKLPGYVNSNSGSQCNGNGDGRILDGDWHRFWIHLDLANTAKAFKYQYHIGIGDIDYGSIQNPYDSATEGRYSMIVPGNWSLFNIYFSPDERTYKDVNILYITIHIPMRTDRGPVFTTEAAYFIDNKLDDGKSTSGNVISGKSVPHPNFGFYGDGLSALGECRNGQEYNLANKSKDCIMAINLDN